MSIPNAYFSNPAPGLHSTFITPKLSPGQRNALQEKEQAAHEQRQFESSARRRFQEASALTQAGIKLSEQARALRRRAALGELQEAREQLSAQERQQRRQIAENFAVYQSGSQANMAARGIAGPGSGRRQIAAAAARSQRAAAVSRSNRAATEAQLMRTAIGREQQAEIQHAQSVLSGVAQLSQLRHQTTASINESRTRVRGLIQEANALEQQFLSQNLQEAIQENQQRWQQRRDEDEQGDIFSRLGFR